MRLLICVAFAALAGCGGGGGHVPDAHVADGHATDGPTVDARHFDDDAPVPDAAKPDAATFDAPPIADAAPVIDAGPPNPPPHISQISWAHSAPCTVGVANTVTITITATDDMPGLAYSGNVISCTPMITGNPAIVTCPELAPYPGTITVTDSGGATDSHMISIAPCTNATMMFP